MKPVIYHNPACSTSCNVLALLRKQGITPKIVEYLKTPPSREELADIIRKTKKPVRDLLRKKGSPYEQLGLDDAKWTDEQLIDQIVQHPVLMNRPVVVTEKGAALCRPPETVLELL